MREDEALDVQAGETLEGRSGLTLIRGEGRGPEREPITDVADGVPDEDQRVRLVEEAEMSGRVPRGLEDHQIAHSIGFVEGFDRAAFEADLREVGGARAYDRLRGTLRHLGQASHMVEVRVREHDVADVRPCCADLPQRSLDLAPGGGRADVHKDDPVPTGNDEAANFDPHGIRADHPWRHLDVGDDGSEGAADRLIHQRISSRGSAPPAGLEPAHPAPEAGALSSELRGRTGTESNVPTGAHSPVCSGRAHRVAGR